MCQPDQQFEQPITATNAEPKVEEPIGETDTKPRSTLGITRICCLIISAIVIYVLGIFTGHLLEIFDSQVPLHHRFAAAAKAETIKQMQMNQKAFPRSHSEPTITHGMPGISMEVIIFASL